jgi:Tol biopolymer transport system component
VSLQGAAGAGRLCGCDDTDSPSIPSGNDPVWSPNGAKIAFTRTDLRAQIYVMKRDGTGLRPLTHNQRVESY